MSTLLLKILITEYIAIEYITTTTTLLLDIFITGYILNEYITIGCIYHWIYSERLHYYWIYLSLDRFSMSTLLLDILSLDIFSANTLLLDIFINGHIVNEYITIGYIYRWIYSQ